VIRSITEIDIDQFRVLDIGSGTGFYLGLWNECANHVVGSDLTEYATNALRERFSEIHQFNVTECVPDALSNRTFDCVSSFDVLFHIVEDNELEAALKNISQLLASDGLFMFSDNLLEYPGAEAYSLGHQKIRTLEQVDKMLQSAGLKLNKRLPVFFLMNDSVCTKNRVIKKLTSLVFRAAAKGERIGYLTGLLLYRIEMLFTKLPISGPSTSIYIYRKSN